MRKAGVQRRRPFCVLSPVLETTCDAGGSLKVSLSARRASRHSRSGVASPTRSRPELSVVSLSRAAWVINGCCFRPHRSQPPGVASGEQNQLAREATTGTTLVQGNVANDGQAASPAGNEHLARRLVRRLARCRCHARRRQSPRTPRQKTPTQALSKNDQTTSGIQKACHINKL